MPRAKSTTVKKIAKAKNVSQDENTLMEFEQFISKKPTTYNSRGRSWLTATLLILIIVLAGAWIFVSRTPQVQKEYKFKAVRLDDNQVYYAKVVKEDSLYIYLDDVYYIMMQDQTIPAQEEGAEDKIVNVPVLIKRGQELHQPQGFMQINRDKIVEIEEIGPDSEIIKEINRQEGL
ncbi:hypothetical protein KKH39_00050 [Patescibacteria group bacterium]|nr:hypothetical protein [Patescibacteria group bacterium]